MNIHAHNSTSPHRFSVFSSFLFKDAISLKNPRNFSNTGNLPNKRRRYTTPAISLLQLVLVSEDFILGHEWHSSSVVFTRSFNTTWERFPVSILSSCLVSCRLYFCQAGVSRSLLKRCGLCTITKFPIDLFVKTSLVKFLAFAGFVKLEFKLNKMWSICWNWSHKMLLLLTNWCSVCRDVQPYAMC